MNTILLSAVIAMSATVANADGYSPQPVTQMVTILEVIPQYAQIPRQVFQRVCYQENVPVRRMSDGGDVLAGALIGGAIGNQFGSGDGKDAMTILGAVAGANVGSNSRPVVGYQTVQNCRDEATTQYLEEFSHYTVIFLEHGQRYRVDTDQHFFIGEKVPAAALY